MTEIRFYHLERQTLEQALPALLSKAYEGGRRVVVRVPDEAAAEALSAHLWTRDPNGFLPHGTARDGFAAEQPVWITPVDENPNGADVLVTVLGAQSAMQGEFALCCDMFDGRNPVALDAARARWKELKIGPHTLTYWQQSETGWERKD